jgi:hypothetical protein
MRCWDIGPRTPTHRCGSISSPASLPRLSAWCRAWLYGWRANVVGDRTGLIPMAIGAMAGLSITVLTIVSTLGPF